MNSSGVKTVLKAFSPAGLWLLLTSGTITEKQPSAIGLTSNVCQSTASAPFYRNYYQPDNVVLIVTGKFKESKALALVQKYLGAIPKPKRKLRSTYTEEPAQDGERNVTLQRVGKVESLLAAYHMPAAAHPDWAPLRILGSVMSESKVGLLEEKLVEPQLATSASGRADTAHDPGLFMFSLQPTENNFGQAKTVMLDTIDRLGSEKFDPAAINRAKIREQRSSE